MVTSARRLGAASLRSLCASHRVGFAPVTVRQSPCALSLRYALQVATLDATQREALGAYLRHALPRWPELEAIVALAETSPELRQRAARLVDILKS